MAKTYTMTIYANELPNMGPASIQSRMDVWSAFIHKTNEYHIFNDKIGFKDVTGHHHNWSYIPPAVESPESYESPVLYLLTHTVFFNMTNEIMSFVFTDKRMYHPNKKYSYNILDMMLKFQSFVYRNIPNIHIELTQQKSNMKIPYKTRLLTHFMTCIAESEVVETETSGHRLLKKSEVKYIMYIISQITSYKPVLTQFRCATCEENHPDRPYHIQLDHADYENDETPYYISC